MSRLTLIKEFEILEGISEDDFDLKDYIKFSRFVQRREKEFRDRIDEISKSNDNINSWGDGFEYAMKLIYEELK
jgi:hypothetical protein